MGCRGVSHALAEGQAWRVYEEDPDTQACTHGLARPAPSGWQP